MADNKNNKRKIQRPELAKGIDSLIRDISSADRKTSGAATPEVMSAMAPEAETSIQRNMQRTQGKSGKALPRINVRFQQDSYDYLKIVSAVKNVTIAKYIDMLIENDMNQNPTLYNKVTKIRKSVKNEQNKE